MKLSNRFRGCIIGGAIGDAFGSGYEFQEKEEDSETFYLFGRPPDIEPEWKITDDTQLTLTTCEFLTQDQTLNPEALALQLVENYKKGLVTNVGSSTLKAIRELEVGGHWSQVGRRGEYAAGNGAAMRIAPLAFKEGVTNELIRDICSITHQNDEAYVGAYCVYQAIRLIVENQWDESQDMRVVLIDCIQDTRIRDRLIECVKQELSLSNLGEIGNDGYVVNTLPLVITAVNNLRTTDIKDIYKDLIQIGGDTDTNCSIFRQIAGAYLGYEGLPTDYRSKLESLSSYDWISRTIDKFIENEDWA